MALFNVPILRVGFKATKFLLWQLALLLILMYVLRNFIMLYPHLNINKGCHSYRSGLSVYSDNVCYPPIRTYKYPPVVANTSRDVESGDTQYWSAPKDCINGRDFWDKVRNSDTVVKRFFQVTVWIQSSTTFFRGDGVFSYSDRCGDPRMNYIPALWSVVSSVTQSVDVAVLVSSQQWGTAYYHWMHEKAFSLGSMREFLNDGYSSIIVEGDTHSKFLEFTDILNISRSRVIYQHHSLVLNVRTLYVPYLYSCATMSRGNVMLTRDWIRDIHTNLYSIPTSVHRIVVIYRNENDVCNRCILNSDSMMNALRVAHPTSIVKGVVLGSMSMYDTMDLLSTTNVLIAPHGAGLANMIFLPNGAKVIEIINKPEQCNMCFYELSLSLNISYRGVMPLRLSDSKVDYNSADIEKVVAASYDV